MTIKPVFRFAPSPNGALHLGHAYSALLNHALAKAVGGRFLIRIENIDPTRCTPALEAAMLDDLCWLGLEWEKPVLRQSERFAAYQATLDMLQARDLIYPAFLTRTQIRQHAATHQNWPHDPEGSPHYPGQEKGWNMKQQAEAMAGAKAFAWRLDMQKALALHPVAGAGKWGDVILGRKETPTSYHLAVVLDDAAQAVSHVVRGLDLAGAAPLHRLLQKILRLNEPLIHHHRLILDREGNKLSKSKHSTSLASLRKQGASACDIRARIKFNRQELDAIITELQLN